MCLGRGVCFGDRVKLHGEFGAVGLMFRDGATLMPRSPDGSASGSRGRQTVMQRLRRKIRRIIPIWREGARVRQEQVWF